MSVPYDVCQDTTRGRRFLPLALPARLFALFNPLQRRASNEKRSLWLLLQRETFRQGGASFDIAHDFASCAAYHRLGAPLARASRLAVGGRTYMVQPFARDTLYREENSSTSEEGGSTSEEAHSLDHLLNGEMPQRGLALRLLQASYSLSGSSLHPDWAFHRVAIRHRLGPPLCDSDSLELEGQEYTFQVFAGDTLYSPVPDWGDVRRLSETPPGSPLHHLLWEETCTLCGADYKPNSPFHQLATSTRLGSPLSRIYPVRLSGARFEVQIFAYDTIYALPGEPPALQSNLLRFVFPGAAPPTEEAPEEASEQPANEAAKKTNPTNKHPTEQEHIAHPSHTPVVSTPEDALSRKRPRFALLPIAGTPPVSQFFGYTRWAADHDREYYSSCQGRHPGIDFAVPIGTPVLSVDYGVVVCAGEAGTDCPFGGCLPKLAIVRHGCVYAIYGHASLVKVRKGQRLNPGDLVCFSGDYGGEHLHFEIRPVPDEVLDNDTPLQPPVNPGYAVNPLYYFDNKIKGYFENCYRKLGGNKHFCCGTLHDQERVIFGGPMDTRACTNLGMAEKFLGGLREFRGGFTAR